MGKRAPPIQIRKSQVSNRNASVGTGDGQNEQRVGYDNVVRRMRKKARQEKNENRKDIEGVC